jgi:tetratricopeptide (TPR) repeat protein
MKHIFLLLILLLIVSCAAKKPPETTSTTSMNADELLSVAKQSSEYALKAPTREKQRNWALHGVSVSEQCLMRKPEEPGCYYYRAINTGLYHEVKIVGYQNGVKRMIDDCNKVIMLEPKYDHGGAFRILGQIYTKLPQTAGRPDSIVRDLDKAEEYLEQAVRISPNYPENYIFLSETLVEKDKYNEAKEALDTAKGLSPNWRHDSAYSSWQETIKDLEKKIDRKIK